MQTEFKEKTYEKYFCAELARKTNVMFSPDQCDEFYLEFDESVFLSALDLQQLIGYRRATHRRRLNGISLADLDHYAHYIAQNLPELKLNCFIQYKRPDYMIRKSAKEWTIWGDKYYRYFLTPHQQAALVELNKKSYGRSAILYASAAFWKDKRNMAFFKKRFSHKK